MPLFYAGFCHSQSLKFRLSPSPYHLCLWPLLSPRQSYLLRRCRCRCLRRFFAVASHPMVRFIVGQLCHPRCRNWLSFSVTFISAIGHRRMILDSSPRLILPSSFFSAFVAYIRLLRSCALLFPSPPSPPSDHKGPPFIIASFSCLLLPVAIFGRLIRHCLRFGRPRTPFQGFYLDFSRISDLRLGLWRCKYVVSRSLHGVLSRIISPGAALRGPGLGRMPALTYYCLSFSAASLRI